MKHPFTSIVDGPIGCCVNIINMEYLSQSEARKLLHNVFVKNANPSMTEIEELAHRVSWDIRRVRRYFINKRANANRKKKFETITTNVEEFFKHWEKQMT